jgi:hypothetical protein
MLQVRNNAGLSFKIAHKTGLVRVLRQDHLDSNFALDNWLVGAMHCTESAIADPLV